jgi:tryptophan-rich sensory protein
VDDSRRALVAVGPPLVAATVGGLAARDAAETYRRMRTPRWAPPAGAFGPVWTALYALIGVAGWRLSGVRDRPALVAHLTQMGLNAAWTPLFFGARRRRAALAVSVALDLAICAEMAVLARRDPLAAGLLAPYLAWSVFATALTAAVGEP